VWCTTGLKSDWWDHCCHSVNDVITFLMWVWFPSFLWSLGSHPSFGVREPVRMGTSCRPEMLNWTHKTSLHQSSTNNDNNLLLKLKTAALHLKTWRINKLTTTHSQVKHRSCVASINTQWTWKIILRGTIKYNESQIAYCTRYSQLRRVSL